MDPCPSCGNKVQTWWLWNIWSGFHSIVCPSCWIKLRPDGRMVAWCTLSLAFTAIACIVWFGIEPESFGPNGSTLRVGLVASLCLLAFASRWLAWMKGGYVEVDET